MNITEVSLKLINIIRQQGLYNKAMSSKKEELRIREIDLRNAVFFAITLARAEISKIRVGAAVLAINSKGDSSIFSGCNIEISFRKCGTSESNF
jgi:hypothetical protein